MNRKILILPQHSMFVALLISTLLFKIIPAVSYSQSTPRQQVRPFRHREHNFARSGKADKETSQRKRDIAPTARSVATFAVYEGLRHPTTIPVRVLENNPGYQALEQRDRAFARLLLSTAERRHGQIDKIIQTISRRAKVKKRLFESLTDHLSSEHQIRFVNALLRKVDRDGDALLRNTTSFDNINAHLAQHWINAYGKKSAAKIVEAAMSQSPIFLTVNCRQRHTEHERTAQWNRICQSFNQEITMKHDIFETVEVLSCGSIRVPECLPLTVSKWPGYTDGDWWVQDPSASLPAIALESIFKNGRANISNPKVVDLCSAPGGKTAQLCSYGFGQITAVEISASRTKKLHDNLRRLKMEQMCEVVIADGRHWQPSDDHKVNAVLLDAPCSATGLGSRRPDVLRKDPKLGDIIQLQRELLANAVDKILSPGGFLVYATCSLLKSEGEEQISWLMSRMVDSRVETVPFIPGEIAGFDAAIDENGWLRILPGHLHGSLAYCDGFFVARLKKMDEGDTQLQSHR